MNNFMLQEVPQHHYCDTRLEERKILVDKTVMKRDLHLVGYCPKCEIYKSNGVESYDPEVVGDHIVRLQRVANRNFERLLSNSENEKP